MHTAICMHEFVDHSWRSLFFLPFLEVTIFGTNLGSHFFGPFLEVTFLDPSWWGHKLFTCLSELLFSCYPILMNSPYVESLQQYSLNCDITFIMNNECKLKKNWYKCDWHFVIYLVLSNDSWWPPYRQPILSYRSSLIGCWTDAIHDPTGHYQPWN